MISNVSKVQAATKMNQKIFKGSLPPTSNSSHSTRNYVSTKSSNMQNDHGNGSGSHSNYQDHANNLIYNAAQ